MHAISELFRRVYDTGPAVLPGGRGIRKFILWDSYFNYEEIDSSINYIWRIHPAFLANHDGVIRVKQTIQLFGHGIHRKHEIAFAFRVGDLTHTKIEYCPVDHPGPGMLIVPHMRQGYDQAYVSSPGYPTGVNLTFREPVLIRRWSCLPITTSITEAELSVFDIPIWFPTEEVAHFAIKQIGLAWEEAAQSASTGSTGIIQTPEFAHIPEVPPGSVRRD